MAMMTNLKHQRRMPFEMLLILKLLSLSCMLLAATALGEENVVANNGECESGNEGNDPGQCNANANSSGGEVEDAKAHTEREASPWYRHLAECKDYSDKCEKWAKKNDCARVPEQYLKLCPKACKVCDNVSGDYISNCYGEAQHVAGDQAEDTALRIREVEDYMFQEVFVDEKYDQIRGDCKNRDEQCSFWAAIGGKKIIRGLWDAWCSDDVIEI
jgi:hypothetical protein